MADRLPIFEVEQRLLRVLREGNRVVLTAPTGSGKTTQAPRMVHGLGGGKVIVLQPRRLAARLVAQRVAWEMNTPVGGLVGYQTRHDSQVSRDTVIRFVTEGLFLRTLRTDPTLAGVGAVVIDEFHERSLAADTALAMTRELQAGPRADLRLVVMSATLDAELVSRYLDCPTVSAEGRLFPVEVGYLPRRSAQPAWDLAAEALLSRVRDGLSGDVLIFMPGGYEIRRTIEACRRKVGLSEGIEFHALHGELPPREQDEAVRPSREGRRKVIVSTNVAETSITIEGVRHVIDSGLARVQRFDARRGINVLAVEGISRSSSEQRSGRAGRVAAGTCDRLWTEQDQRGRAASDTPEVRRLDLAEVVLQLKDFGVADVRRFGWLEPPEEPAVERATRVLVSLGALADDGALTPRGRTMAKLPMHPRFSRMLVEASARGCLERVTLWAALMSERDILVGAPRADWTDADGSGLASDFLVLERAFAEAARLGFDAGRCAAAGIHAQACREVERTRRLFVEACDGAGLSRRSLPGAPGAPGADGDDFVGAMKSLLAGFSDHVAVRRAADNLHCAMAGQKRAVLDKDSVARRVGLIVAVDVREIANASGPRAAGLGGEVRTQLSLAGEVERAWLEELFPGRVTVEFAPDWNAKMQCVEEVERHAFDGVVFDQTPRPNVEPARAAAMLAERIIAGDAKLDTWDEAVEQWIARTRCVAQWFPERRLITYDPDDLRVIVEEICAGASRLSQVKGRPCLEAVKGALSWEDQRFVERMAPDRIDLPRGWRMKVEYQPGAAPRGRAKIQDFYDVGKTPTVAGGRVKVLLEILGPNFRPVQVTDDLPGFWERLYPELKKELKRRYPRHEWR